MNVSQVEGPLTITGLSDAGDGLSNEGPVAGTLPGEVIEGGKIRAEAAERIAPVCRHFGACGGCTTQHVHDSFLAQWKRARVQEAFAQQGLSPDVRLIHVSAPGTRRRLVLTGRRTKKTTQIGFYARRSDVLVPISECPVAHPGITGAFDALHAIVRLAASRTSHVRLTVTLVTGGLDLSVEDAAVLDRERLAALAAPARQFLRVTWNSESVLQAEPPVLSFGAAEVTPPPGAFLQATAEGEAALLDAVRSIVKGAPDVVDLFCGVGTFALPLAREAEVHAVELDPAMIAALDAGWRKAPGLKRVTTEARDLFQRPLLRDELKGRAAVVLDPPRAGAAAQIEEIACSDVPCAAYVSCNPITLARDAGRLVAAGFALGEVQVVDQFRWSGHIELACGFTRKAG